MKYVTIVIPEGNIILSSITGSFQILTRANEYWQRQGNPSRMEVRIAGLMPELKLDEGFFSVYPIPIHEIKNTDLLIVPAFSRDYDQVLHKNQELIHWIGEQYQKKGAEVASICTGAFLLAASGILKKKTCSTHWNAAPDFRRLFPEIDLQTDQLIAAQDGIYTNGGAYSFLNLMLFLVEKYFDRSTAIYCSKVFQIDMGRSSQSPFHIFQTQKNHGDELIDKAQTYIEEHLNEKISFEALSSKLAISRRNFDRRFIKATANTPMEYLQRARIEVAKRSLEEGKKTIFEVMDDVGYSDDKAFREVFKKITGVTPQEYKSKYTKEIAEV